MWRPQIIYTAVFSSIYLERINQYPMNWWLSLSWYYEKKFHIFLTFTINASEWLAETFWPLTPSNYNPTASMNAVAKRKIPALMGCPNHSQLLYWLSYSNSLWYHEGSQIFIPSAEHKAICKSSIRYVQWRKKLSQYCHPNPQTPRHVSTVQWLLRHQCS